MKWLALLVMASSALLAEERVMTLKQAVDLAQRQNPELAIARLDEQKSLLGVNVVKEPLMPKITLGSGLAYTYGFPLSIEGSAPSIIEANATRSIYNAQRNQQVARAREAARGTGLQTAATREDVVLRAAVLFLDLEKAWRAKDLASRQVDHLKRVEGAVRLRVEEGRELPLESRRAALNVAKGQARLQSAKSSFAAAQRALALGLGLEPEVEIVPAMEDRPLPSLPETEDHAVTSALRESKELRKLQSDAMVKTLEARSLKATRLPTINFVAKYGLFGRFNNFEDYFLRFQRNNGLIGASFQMPLFANSSDLAQAAQSEIDANRLRVQATSARGRIESDTRGHWARVLEADQTREVARLDLELQRETVSVLLAQFEEGRVTVRQLEEARFLENERWMSLWEAQYAAERARFELLRQTETLSAAMR